MRITIVAFALYLCVAFATGAVALEPSPGKYRLTSSTGLVMTVEVHSGGTMSTPIGTATYHPHPKDYYQIGSVIIEFDTATTFVALVNPGESDEQQHHGSVFPSP